MGFDSKKRAGVNSKNANGIANGKAGIGSGANTHREADRVVASVGPRDASASEIVYSGKNLASPPAAALKCVLVSVFGRANWLALHLRRLGWTVQLVDVSAAILGSHIDGSLLVREDAGGSDPDPIGDCHLDAEGPFGLFQNSKLTAEQKTFWAEPHFGREQSQGFVLLTRDGPIEGQGPLADFLLQARGFDPSVIRYIKELLDANSEQFSFERRMLARKPFQKAWLAHFAHSFAGNQMFEHFDACEHGHASAILSPLWNRRTSAESWQRELQTLREAGVDVVLADGIEDFQILGPTAEILKLKNGNQALEVTAGFFVWSLTGRETRVVNGELAKRLFPEWTLEPDWFWVRLPIEGGFSLRAASFPESFTVIEDENLPWTHANCVFLKMRGGDAADIWLRVPKSYMDETGDDLLAGCLKSALEILNRRLPNVDMRIANMPAAVKQAKSRFPIHVMFDPEKLQHLKVIKTRNLFFDGPEVWFGLDPLSRFQFQTLIAQKLESLRRTFETAKLKREAKGARGDGQKDEPRVGPRDRPKDKQAD